MCVFIMMCNKIDCSCEADCIEDCGVVILSVEIDVADAGNFDRDTFAMLVDKTIEEKVVEVAG